MRLLAFVLFSLSFTVAVHALPYGEGTMRDVHPKAFIRNGGQWPAGVRYGILGSSAKAALTPEGVELFALTSTKPMPLEYPPLAGGSALVGSTPEAVFARTRVRFLHPSPHMNIVEGEEAVTRMHFYHGRDKSGWHEDVGTVQSVTYTNVWENIDIEYRFDGHHLRQWMHIRPGGNPRDIAFVIDGADAPETVLRLAGENAMLSGKMPMEIRVDTLRPRPGPDLTSWRQLVETEFCTFFGGRGNEKAWDIDVDAASRMALFMLTSSGELPLANEMQNMIRGGYDHYLAQLDCDGNTLLSGTYFGSSRSEISYTNYFPYGNPSLFLRHLSRIHRTRSGDLLLSTHADNPDFPTTPGTVQPTFKHIALYTNYGYSNDVLMRFSSAGKLLASTFLEGPTFANIVDISTGPDEDVYVLGQSTGEQWFITPGTVHPAIAHRNLPPEVTQGSPSTGFIVRLAKNLDAVRWGTYFFNSNGRNIDHFDATLQSSTPGISFYLHKMDMEIDDEGCPVIVGTSDTLSRLPITRSFGAITSARPFAWLVRLASDALSYRYAVSIHSDQLTSGIALVLDGDGNALIAGSTGEQGFPALSPRLFPQATSPLHTPYLAKFDPSGNLLNSAVLGGNDVATYYKDIALSRCGEVVLGLHDGFGGSREIGPRDPERSGVGSSTRNSLMVCDSAFQSVSFAAWMHRDSDGQGMWATWYTAWTDFLEFDDAGYFYNFSGDILSQHRFALMYNSSRIDEDPRDVILSRHHYPVCQLISCSLAAVDTIIVPDSGEPLVPTEFPVTVTVSSDGAAVDALQVTGDLFLPAGITTLTGDSVAHLVFAADTMRPQSNISRTVMVRAARGFQSDVIPYTFIGFYTDSRETSSCLRPLTVCHTQSIVRHVGEYKPLPECELEVDESLIKYPADQPCTPGTVPARLTLRHRGVEPWQLGTVALRLADGMGVSFALAGDSLRGDRVLYPGDTIVYTWLLNVRRGRTTKLARILAEVCEQGGTVLTECVAALRIQPAPGVGCSLTLPGTVTWDVTQNRALTDPIPVRVILSSHIDSSLGLVTARIDLARAPRLQLQAGETEAKQLGFLGPCASKDVGWLLFATEPAQEYTSDTVVVYYTIAGDSVVYSCDGKIQFQRLDRTMLCNVSLADTLSASLMDETRMDTVRIHAEINNTGTVSTTLGSAKLVVSGVASYIPLDPLERAPGQIGRGATLMLDWRILIPASRYARDFMCELLVRDNRGDTVAMCSATAWVRPLQPALQCELDLPDTVVADEHGAVLFPDPLMAVATVRNISDTLSGGAVTIDLTRAPELRLAVGEPVMRTLPVLLPRDSAKVSWKLEAVGPVFSQLPETVDISVSSVSGQDAGTCSETLLLNGTPRFATLRCAAFGHDSAYYDSRYEAIVPDPLQVGYSLFNEGNVDVLACEVSLLLPSGWKFADGVVNPAVFGKIAARDTVTRTWLITPDVNLQWSDEITLAFQPHCTPDTVLNTCEHSIGFAAQGLWNIAVTPIRLDFAADRDGPLPAEQAVRVWTPRADPLVWSANVHAPWLGVQPSAGSGPGLFTVQPSTTQLAEGTLTTPISIIAQGGMSKLVQVVYTIRDKTNHVSQSPTIVRDLAVYPNPYSVTSGSGLRVLLPPSLLAAGAPFRLTLHDVLGRTLYHKDLDVEDAAGGIVLPASTVLSANQQLVILTVANAIVHHSVLLLLTP